jgi:hypothetical protein
MATSINYNIGVSTSQGVQALNNLQAKLGQTNTAFATLKSAVLGFATAGFVGGLYQSAAALVDVAGASGVSTQALLGFQKAVKQFGGSAEGALDGIGKFAQAIDGAANGSKGLQSRFLDLGVSLDDLRTLSEEELLNKVVKNLGQGENGAAKMAAAIELFGKKFKNVNFKDVAANIDAYTESQKRAAAATEAADRAEEAFGNALGSFKSQLLIALKPISELATALLSMKAVIQPLITAVIGFGGAWLLFAKVIPAVKTGLAAIAISVASSGGAIAALGTQLAGVQAGVLAFGRNIARAFGFLPTAYGGVASLTFAFSGLLRGLLRFAGIFGIFYTIYEIINSLITSITGSGLIEWADRAGKALAGVFGVSYKLEAEKVAEANKKLQRTARDVEDAYKGQRGAIKEVVDSFARQNEKSSAQLKLETELIGKSKEYSELRRAQAAIDEGYTETLRKLETQRANLTKEEQAAGLGGDLDEQIKQLKLKRDAAKAVADADIKANNEAQNNDQFTRFGLEGQVELNKQLKAAKDNLAKSTMSELEAKKADLRVTAENRALEKIASEEQRLGRDLSAAEKEKYKNEALKGLKQLQDAAEEEYVSSRRFSRAWKIAFEQYVDNATNAATQAQRIFQSVTQNLEDALFQFFTTGKLGWKDFANNVIQEMIRIQTRQLAANLLSGVGAGGGGGGRSGGLLGGAIIPGFLAEGGPAGANKPYIVGERGPELFVPNTTGTVVPNNALGGGGNVTYNINAVDAMSFKQMLAQDPTFLHAVAEQGRRRLPGAR